MANETTLNRRIANMYAVSELLEILAAVLAVIGTALAWGEWWIVTWVLLASLLLVLLALPFKVRGVALEEVEQFLDERGATHVPDDRDSGPVIFDRPGSPA